MADLDPTTGLSVPQESALDLYGHPFRAIWQQLAGDLGITTARMRESLLDQQGRQVAEMQNIGQGAVGMLGEIDRLRPSAVRPQDQDQLDTLSAATKFNATLAMRGDKDALTRLAGNYTQLLDYSKQNEAQSIADEQTKYARGEEGEKLRYSRDVGLSGDLRKEMNGYADKLTSVDQASALLNDPKAGGIGRDLAFVGLVSAIDPGVKRGEDGQIRYEGSNGLIAQFTDAYNRYRGRPDQERLGQLQSIADTLRGQITGARDRTIASYQKQTQAYGGDWNRVGSVVPDYQPPSSESGDTASTSSSPPPAAKESPPAVAALAAAKAALDVASASTPDTVKALGVGGVMTAGKWLPWILRGAAASPAGALGTAGLAGLGALTVADPREGLAIKPEEVQSNGTIRGVYVPKFLRRRFPRNTDEYRP